MRKGLVTQKDIIKKVAEEHNLPEENVAIFYDFLVYKFNKMSEDPNITVISLSNDLGRMFVRSKVLKGIMMDGLDGGSARARKFARISEKRLENLAKTFKDVNLSHHSKTFTVNSAYLSLDMTKEEMEREQNKDFEQNNRVE